MVCIYILYFILAIFSFRIAYLDVVDGHKNKEDIYFLFIKPEEFIIYFIFIILKKIIFLQTFFDKSSDNLE